MNKLWIALAIILGILAAILVARLSDRPDEQVASSLPALAGAFPVDRVIKLEGQGHLIEGTLATVETFQFLMKDEGRAVGTYSGDAFLTTMSLKKAEELRDRYGDFFNCNDPGVQQAVRSMQPSILVGHTPEAKKAIGEAMALVRQGKVPVVSFQGGPLSISRQEYNGMKVNDSTGIPVYYLADFKIVTENFSASE